MRNLSGFEASLILFSALCASLAMLAVGNVHLHPVRAEHALDAPGDATLPPRKPLPEAVAPDAAPEPKLEIPVLDPPETEPPPPAHRRTNDAAIHERPRSQRRRPKPPEVWEVDCKIADDPLCAKY
jgi:hypothetical protein